MKLKTVDLALCGLFAAILAVCAWITVPFGPIPFTLQTFGVFAVLGILGGKRGTISILVYLLLGAVGLPVFSGFHGGVGALFGVTGGYLIGFLLTGAAVWLAEKWFGDGFWSFTISAIIGLLLCYAFGTAWFMILYTKGGNEITLAGALGMCVIPFLIPDAAKLAVALLLRGRLKKLVPKA